MLHTRLFPLTNVRLEGQDIVDRLKVMLTITIKGLLVECAGVNLIPAALIKTSVDTWSMEMAELAAAKSKYDPAANPQITVDLKDMTCKIFEGYTAPRAAISPFVRPGVGFKGMASTRTIRDEHLALELEERGLRDIVLPKEDTRTEGRRRIGERMQATLKEIEAEREKRFEEQRRLDNEAKELDDTGFGRKVDLD